MYQWPFIVKTITEELSLSKERPFKLLDEKVDMRT